MALKDKNVLMCFSHLHFLKENDGSVVMSNLIVLRHLSRRQWSDSDI